jgi:hypothetical protein
MRTTPRPGLGDHASENWWTVTIRPTATLLPASVRLRQLVVQAKALGLEVIEARPLAQDLAPLAPVDMGNGYDSMAPHPRGALGPPAGGPL